MTVALELTLAPDVERAQGGDVEAFARLVEGTSSMVCGVAFAIVRDLAASEDIAQDVFLSVWKGLGKLQSPKSFLPWLRQMTRNHANGWLRRVYSRRAHDHDDDMLALVADPQPGADASFEERESLQLVASALESVPDEAREVLVLYYREGQSTAQVGQLLGLSRAAVRKRLSRARELVRDDVAAKLRRGLERTAPGAALVTAIVASVATTTGPASALTVGGLAARGAAAGSFKFGGVLAVLAALPGILGGVAGVVLGLRDEFLAAIDDREIKQLERLRAVAIATVVLTALGLLWSAGTGTWVAPTVVSILFISALGVIFQVWLPRIAQRRLEHELATDPEAPERHRQRRRISILGFAIGAVLSAVGLMVGLWASGLVGFPF